MSGALPLPRQHDPCAHDSNQRDDEHEQQLKNGRGRVGGGLGGRQCDVTRLRGLLLLQCVRDRQRDRDRKREGRELERGGREWVSVCVREGVSANVRHARKGGVTQGPRGSNAANKELYTQDVVQHDSLPDGRAILPDVNYEGR